MRLAKIAKTNTNQAKTLVRTEAYAFTQGQGDVRSWVSPSKVITVARLNILSGALAGGFGLCNFRLAQVRPGVLGALRGRKSLLKAYAKPRMARIRPGFDDRKSQRVEDSTLPSFHHRKLDAPK